MRKSNYTCQGINCKECVTVNRYRTCLMEDVQIYCDDILGADDNYVEKLEKENELLAKRITELQANIVKLTDEVTELIKLHTPINRCMQYIFRKLE